MRLGCFLLSLLAIAPCCLAQQAAEGLWRPMYQDGGWAPGASAWIGEGTRSERTGDGLLIADTSTDKGSGRFYQLKWQADPARGAALEARVKVISCSQGWGVCMMVADGVHEEGLTLFPDRVELVNAARTLMMDTASDFHTYRLEICGQDLRLRIDGQLVADLAGRFTTPAVGTPPRNQCGFGSGASDATGEAVWQWVQYRSDLPETGGREMPDIPGLTVAMGETVEIVPGAVYRSLFKFRDGRLSVGGMVSADEGRTWQRGPGVGVGAFEFPDGEVISPGFNTRKLAAGVFEVPLSRSIDGGKSFTGESARLNIPDGTGGTGDDGKYYEGPPVDHAVVQLRDGSLLMAMYGYFTTDTVPCPAFPPEWKVYKYRTWVMRSTDRGRTWDYWATVAYDPEVGCESFCEADLLALPGGELLCFMRTGGNPPRYVTPLYMSRSMDDGKTWSKPVPIADRGVWPNACRMEDGTLVVTYGRPGNWLAFSLDEGKSWVGHLCFYEGTTTSYNSVEEVAPGRLLVVYDRAELDVDGNQARGVVGTFFTVERR